MIIVLADVELDHKFPKDDEFEDSKVKKEYLKYKFEVVKMNWTY